MITFVDKRAIILNQTRYHSNPTFPRRLPRTTSVPTNTYCTIAMGGGTSGFTGDGTGALRQAASLSNLL